MPPSDSQLERQEAIREAVEQLLDLILSDQEIATLLEGKALSFEQLFQSHSLTKLGGALIQLDSFLRLNRGNQESSGCNPGCRPVPPPPLPKLFCLCVEKPSVMEFRLHPDWLQ
jgi:hypothetical protein